MSLRSFLIPAALLLPMALPQLASAIVGGKFASHSDFPYVVQLPGCSGTKVGPSHLLTAGHCLSFSPGEGAYPLPTVKMNLVTSSGQVIGEELEVKNLFIHPQYFMLARNPDLHREDQGPDVAIIEVVASRAFDELPILSLYHDSIWKVERALVVGWGQQFDNLVDAKFMNELKALHQKYPSSKKALKYIVADMDDRELADHFTLNDYDSEGQPNRAALRDSGGPALVAQYGKDVHLLLGIVGFRNKGGGKMRYTKASSFADWLENVLTERIDPTPIIPRQD